MNKYEKYALEMMNAWENPPAPFNKDYNEKTVKAYDLHSKEISDYGRELDKIKPELSDEDFDYLYNTFARKSYIKYITKSFDEEYVKGFLKRRNFQTLSKHGLSEKDIRFTNPTPDGRNHYQDIELKGKNIGALIEREKGALEDIQTIYQKLFNEKYLNVTKNIKVSDTSEDAGYFYAQFDELDDLIEFQQYIEKKENLTQKQTEKKVVKKTKTKSP